MKIINFQKAKARITSLRRWNRSSPLPDGIPAPWTSVRGKIIRALRNYQQRRIIRIQEVYRARGDDPA